MRSIQVCVTPELIHQYELAGTVVVVVDIFRATSCMITGFAHGANSIHPVLSVEECFQLGRQGMLTAGERGGVKIEGFDLGNSPYDYMNDSVKGRDVAISTTNGTKTILASLDADEVLIGAFLNLKALCDYLSSNSKDVLIHCAGWKGMVNLEDTLFAGALIVELASSHAIADDSARIAQELYMGNSSGLVEIAGKSSHAKRLAGFGVEKDLSFCMSKSLFEVIPHYKEGALYPLIYN